MREGSERKVRPGDKLSAISAVTWNKVIDSIKDFKSKRFKEGLSGAVTDHISPSNTILIKNTVGTFTNSFRVLGVGDPLLTADTDPHNLAERLAFEGYTPDATETPFCITQEPAEEDGIVKAVVSGYTLAYVEILDVEHQYANPINGVNEHLESAECGQAKIIKTVAGGNPPTGTTLAIVQLIGQLCPEDIVDPTDPYETACDGTDGAWIYGLLESQCLYLEIVQANGFCSQTPLDQGSYMRWDETDSAWRTQEWDCLLEQWVGKNIEFETTESVMRLFIQDGRVRLQIADLSYDLGFVCGGEGCLLFSGGGELPCEPNALDPGNPDYDSPPCKDHFLVRVCCSCCPIDGWDGPGWYIVVDEGESCEDCGQLTVIELFDIDACDDEVVICSCRYDSEEDAQADLDELCPPGVSVACCPEDELPTVLYLAGGSLGSVTLTWDEVALAWLGNNGTYDIRFYCDGSTFNLQYNDSGWVNCPCTNGEDPCSWTCNPFVWPTAGSSTCGSVDSTP